VLENLQLAWRAATMEEKQELCQIMVQPQLVRDNSNAPVSARFM
jgi:hypothetical protein